MESIVLEESNVENIIHDVVVEEEVLKDDASIVLSQEQIVNELTTMLMSRHKQMTKVAKKVNLFVNLFSSAKDDNVVQKRPDNLVLQPIVLCKKVVTVHDDKGDIYGDKGQDVLDMFMIKARKFQAYINDLHNHNTSKSTPYINTMNTLYALSRPFATISSGETSLNMDTERTTPTQPTEFFRHFVFEDYSPSELQKGRVNMWEKFRTIPQISIDTSKRPDPPDDKPGCTAGLHYNTTPNALTVYGGDSIDIIGFMSLPVGIAAKSVGNLERFSINKYTEAMQGLLLQSKVEAVFNDYMFDRARKVVDSLQGTIVKKDKHTVTIKFFKQICAVGAEYTDTYEIPLAKPSFCFLYDTNWKEVKFAKPLLKSKRIAFDLHQNGVEITLKYIVPSTPSEVLCASHSVLDKKQFSMCQFRRFCCKVGLDFDNLPVDVRDIMQMYISHANSPRRDHIINQPLYSTPHESMPGLLSFGKDMPYSKKYLYKNTFGDCSLQRTAFLHNKIDYGYIFFIDNLLSKLEKRVQVLSNIDTSAQLDDLRNKLEHVRKEMSESTSKVARKTVIAKQYTNIKDLEGDNDKRIYFDRDLDPTRYDVRNQFANNLQGNELKYSLIEALSKDERQKGKSNSELESEAKCIMKGRRLVREGEHAVLSLEDGTSMLYVRIPVEDKKMWVKVFKAPFPICTDTLDDNTKLLDNPETPTLDPFELVCKKTQNLHAYAIQNTLLQKIRALESVTSFVAEFDTLKKGMKDDTKSLNLLLKLCPNEMTLESIRKPIKITLTQDSHADDKENKYADYIGESDLLDLDKVYNNIEYGDAAEYHIEHKQVPAQPAIMDNEERNADILETLVDLLDINLSKDMERFILKFVSNKHPNTIAEKVRQKEAQIRESQKKVYEKAKSNPKFLADFNNLIKKKVSEFEDAETRKFYANVVVSVVSLLNICMIIEYPNLRINRHLPKCVKAFSYIGYPVVENKNTSFTKYLCCILTSLGNPGDQKFDSFSHMTVQQIEDLVHTEIDAILESQHQLASLVQTKKEFIRSTTHLQSKSDRAPDFGKYMSLNLLYKPSFMFPEHKGGVLALLSAINNTIKSAEHQKLNQYNRPLIGNMCCIERLTSTTNFYDFFKDIKNDTKKWVKEESLSCSATYKPKSLTTSTENLFISKNVKLHNSKEIPHQGGPNQENRLGVFIEANPLFEANEFSNTDEEWDEKLASLFDLVIETVRKYRDPEQKEIDTDLVMKLKNLVVTLRAFLGMTSADIPDQIQNLRASMMSFLKYRLPTMLSQIVHQKLMQNNEDWNMLIEMTTQNKNYAQILPKIKTIIPTKVENLFQPDETGNEHVTKNMTIMVYVVFKVLYSMLFVTAHDDSTKIEVRPLTNPSSATKKLLAISSTIVYDIIERLHAYILLNDSFSDVKKRVEELREEQKRAKMFKYSADDETRRLQLMLEKMGISVSDQNAPPGQNAQNQQDILQHDNKMQEAEQYKIGDYHGENAEENEDLDQV